MCMRPCGPIRHSYRSTIITKKYVMEHLEDRDTIVEVFPKDSDSECSKYTGAISKLKALIRLGATEIVERNFGDRSSDRSIKGYRNVYIYNDDYPDNIIVRIKRDVY